MNLIFIIAYIFLFLARYSFCICLSVFLGNQADEHISGVQFPVKHRCNMNLCFVFAIGSYPPYMKIARQRVSATKSGNGLQKTFANNLNLAMVTIYTFLFIFLLFWLL